jgi:hypothetical protein
MSASRRNLYGRATERQHYTYIKSVTPYVYPGIFYLPFIPRRCSHVGHNRSICGSVWDIISIFKIGKIKITNCTVAGIVYMTNMFLYNWVERKCWGVRYWNDKICRSIESGRSELILIKDKSASQPFHRARKRKSKWFILWGRWEGSEPDRRSAHSVCMYFERFERDWIWEKWLIWGTTLTVSSGTFLLCFCIFIFIGLCTRDVSRLL